ncbi:MAG: cation:proton antiporter [Candidatus Daviesbacteria bacterium]|nr:cation:proton antiporter [Candidatus Daviesbacteria bacterium]
MNNVFVQLAIILGLASFLGFFIHKMKLPLLIAYLLGGLLIALWGIFDIRTSEALSFLPEVGLAFLLFLVGMELDLREIRSFGKPIIISGILQVVITTILGTFIAQSFNFSLIEAIYLGVGLSFSSTIVVVKLLLDKKDLGSLYGKLSLGILLLEDLLAVVILLGLTSTTSVLGLGLTQSLPIVSFMGKALILFSLALLLSHYILGTIFKAVSESSELLFLSALAWCFTYVTFSLLLGFSVVIGAFLAGVALANSPYHFQIQGKVKPMRDFFVALFFVYLGTKVNFAHIGETYQLILAFTLYAVFVKPVLFLLLLGSFGFRKHTIFQSAINLSQISEFSLIIILVGAEQGLVGEGALSVIASSALLSIIISSVFISQGRKIYKLIESFVGFFERGHQAIIGEEAQHELKEHVVLIGSHQVGEFLIRFLQKEKTPFVILDFNPYQVEKLIAEKIPVIFGDMGDPEVLDVLNLEEAHLVISTVPDRENNELLIEDLRSRSLKIPIIVRSDSFKEAKLLYKLGANFVFLPDVVSGEFLVEMLKNHLSDRDYFEERPKIEMEKLSRKNLAWQG